MVVKPGFDIDNLVASRIMGMTEVFKLKPNSIYLPNYSTDIKAAELVIIEMERQGFEYMEIPNINCEYVQFEKDDKAFEGKAYTLPHAICLAALKAHGVEIASDK